MYDTWIIDQIQNLVLGNHDTVVYEDMSNASDYKETAESFDTTAIHDSDLHQALVNHWDTKIKKESVKLTNDHKHLCKKMGIPLPFLPFGTMEERILFNTLALSKNFPSMSKEDARAVKELILKQIWILMKKKIMDWKLMIMTIIMMMMMMMMILKRDSRPHLKKKASNKITFEPFMIDWREAASSQSQLF